MPYPDLRKNLINQVCRRFHHAPCITGRAGPSPFTRECDQKIVTTIGAGSAPGQSHGPGCRTEDTCVNPVQGIQQPGSHPHLCSGSRPARFRDDLARPDKPRCVRGVGADKTLKTDNLFKQQPGNAQTEAAKGQVQEKEGHDFYQDEDERDDLVSELSDNQLDAIVGGLRSHIK